MQSTLEREKAAAREFLAAIVKRLRTERGVHTETAIAGAARMAGTFLLRSFHLPIGSMKPGQPLFSDIANDRGPMLVGLLGSTLEQMNLAIDPERLGTIGRGCDQPQVGLLETQRLLEETLTSIKDRYQLAYEDAACAAAIATALLIEKMSSILDPHVSFNIAAYSFVEGMKTVPQRLEPEPVSTGQTPWYQLFRHVHVA